MQIYPVVPGMILELGKFGTNITRAFRFDIKQWQTDYPNGYAHILHKRPDMSAPAPVANTETGDGYIDWIVSSGDVAVVGEGEAEVVLMVADEEVAKSGTFVTVISESLTPVDADPPDPYQGWVEQVLNAATGVQTSAVAAAASATAAAGSATNAAGSATAAAGSASAAAASATRSEQQASAAALAAGAASSAEEASREYAANAEAWAVGQKNGTDVPSTDERYHNNAKWYALAAQDQADAAAQSAEDAEDSAAAAAQSAQQAQDAVDSYDEMTATVEMLPAGSAPTASVDHSGSSPVLQLGLPKAYSGVYVGSDTPSDDYDVWIDPDGEANVAAAEGVYF